MCSLLFCTSLHAAFYDARSYNIYESYCTLLRDGYSHELNGNQKHDLFAGWNHDWVVFNQVKYSKLPEKRVRELLSEMYGELIYAKLNALVKDSLNNWVKQGEFEKQNEYQSRLNTNFKILFEKYCNNLFQPFAFRITPLQYDADNENYLIEFDYDMPNYYEMVNIISGFPYGKVQGLSTSWDAKTSSDIFTVQMNVDDAKYLKEHWRQIKVFDVVFGMREFSVVPASFSFIINDHKYDVNNYNLLDFVVCASNLGFNIGSLQDVKYNYTLQGKQLIARKTQMLKEIEKANVQAEIEKFKESQYYLQLTADQQKDILLPYQHHSLSITDDAWEVDKFYQLLTSQGISEKLKEEVRKINLKSYNLGYLAEHPTLKDTIQREYQDYMCHYTYSYFINDYLAGTLDISKKTCRDEAWALYGSYYNSREDFNNDYSKGVDIATLANYIYDISQILGSTFKMLIGGEWVEYPVATMKLENANNPYNPQPVRDLNQKYSKLNYHPLFQEKAAETIIQKSYYAKKEYDKNGTYFSSKRKFITAYFSSDYKTILKEVKKAK